MRLFETTSQKVVLGTAAASLAALGIVVVASNIAPKSLPQPEVGCRLERAHTQEPPPPPTPTVKPVAPRPLPAPSK